MLLFLPKLHNKEKERDKEGLAWKYLSHRILPVKSIAVGLKDSFEESILFNSGTNSGGIEEKASLDK